MSYMPLIQFTMEHDLDNKSRQELRREIEQELKQEMAKYKKYKQDETHKKNDLDDYAKLGCLALLRKLTCSLQCGGTSCSVKETEQQSGSTSPSVSASSSLESVAVEQPSAVKSRKRPQKKKQVQDTNADPTAPVVKKARRPSKKKQQASETIDHLTMDKE